MPAQERVLEANAAACQFNLTLDVQETEWTWGAWRKLLQCKVHEAQRLNPEKNQPPEQNRTETEGRGRVANGKQRPRINRVPIQDQALVMAVVGTIQSPNCHFTAHINATAVRTNWEATTSMVINYFTWKTQSEAQYVINGYQTSAERNGAGPFHFHKADLLETHFGQSGHVTSLVEALDIELALRPSQVSPREAMRLSQAGEPIGRTVAILESSNTKGDIPAGIPRSKGVAACRPRF